MTAEYFFRLCSVFSPVIPLMALLRNIKLERYQTVVIALILVSFGSDLITTYVIRRGNYYMLHGYGLVESVLLFALYALVLKRRIFVIIAAGIFIVFYFINSLTFEYMKFNAYGRSVECLFMLTLALMLFYQFYNDEEDIFIDQSPLFWINIAIFVYFSGALFSFILSREILSSKALPWTLHNVCNVLKNLLFAIAIWKIPSTRKLT